MNSRPRVVLNPIPGLTAEEARDARARAWSFVFECYEEHKATGRSGGGGDSHPDRRLRTTKEVRAR